MAQTGQADAQPPRLPPQPQVQGRRKRLVAADDLPSLAMHHSPNGRTGSADIRQHVAEETFMLFSLSVRRACATALRNGWRVKGRAPRPARISADLLLHKGQRGVIANQMVPLLQGAPPAILLLRDGSWSSGARSDPVADAADQTGRQLLPNRAVGQIETPPRSVPVRPLVPHHLHWRRHALRDERGAQNVMAIDHLLHRRQPGIQARAAVETQHCDKGTDRPAPPADGGTKSSCSGDKA